MKNLKRRRVPAFRYRPMALTAAALFGGMPATASLAQVRELAQIEEIVVTATRRDEGIQDIPINITAVTSETIEQQKLENLADLVRTVPGLFLVDQGGRDANLLTVRGLNVSSLASSEGVGTDGSGVVAQYIGDIPLFIDLRLLDIERVEALLGPQGTLYGAGTLGGAVRYLPKRPQFDRTTLNIEAGGYAGSHSEGLGSETTVIGNLPLTSNLALRGVVGYYDDPGFIDYGYVLREPGVSNPEPDLGDPAARDANLRRVEDANDLETLAGRLSLRWAISDALEANLGYHYQEQKAGARTINQVESFDTGRYESANRYLEPNDRKNQLVSLEVDADFGFATLTSATGWSKYDEDGQRDQTDLLLNFEYGYENFPAFSAYTREIAEEKRFNQEIRLVSNADGMVDWIVGAFYNSLDLDATSSEFVPGFPEYAGIDRPDNLEYFQATTEEFTEKAIFGEVGLKLSDRFKVTVGGRWFEFEDDQSVGFALPLIDGSLPDEILLDPESVRVEDRDSILKFNASYQLTPEQLSYLTISEGYRTGGSNAVPPCENPLPPGQNVCALPDERLITPDKTVNYEVGLKSTSWGGRLVLNGNLYYISWKDIQVAGTTVNGNIPITVNAAQAVSRGVELAAQAQFDEHWSLGLNYSYNKAALAEDAPGIVGGIDASSHDRLPGSPRHLAHAVLGYEHALPRNLKLNADYVISAQDGIYTRVGLQNDGEILGGYMLHDASVRVSSDRWTVRLYAKNLLDKYAETGVRGTPGFVRSISGDADGDGTADQSFRLRSYYKSVLEPMRVGLTLSYSFGG